jgi:tRNA(Ile)-lysidine synthase
VGYEAVTQAVTLANTGRTGQQRPLVHDLRLRIDYESVVIEQTGMPVRYAGPLLPVDAVLPVAIPGVTALPGSEWQLHAQIVPATESNGLQARLSIPPGAVIELRTRRPGDRFAPLGMGGHTKSIKAWMIDQKIPRAVRSHVPMLTIDGIIAALITEHQWIIGEKFAVRQGSAPGIHFQLTNVPPA